VISLDKAIERARFVEALSLEAAHRSEVIQALIQLAERFSSVIDAVENEDQTQSSAATLLVKLAEQAVLIHAPDGGDGFAILSIDGHKETWPLRSKGFKRYIARLFYSEYEKTPGRQALQDGLAVIGAMAVYDGPERQIFIRVGELNGKIYIDLADDKWRAVEIGPDGWSVVDIPPVEFCRPKGMLPLPVPILSARGTLLRSRRLM
jgi:hypothetical protein